MITLPFALWKFVIIKQALLSELIFPIIQSALWMVAPCWEDCLFTARGCLSRQTLGIETIISTPQFLDSCFFYGRQDVPFPFSPMHFRFENVFNGFSNFSFFLMIHDDISILIAIYCWLTVNTGHTNWFLKKDNVIWGRKLKVNMYLKGSIRTI